MSNSQVIPFGKYKGQPLEVLANDPKYVDWLVGQDWFREKFAAQYTVIVNNFAEATETPEHNSIQMKFLDEKFLQAFVVKACGLTASLDQAYFKNDISRIKAGNHYKSERRDGESDADRTRRLIAEAEEEFSAAKVIVPNAVGGLKLSATFEKYGWDVIVEKESGNSFLNFNFYSALVEIKPSLGDDFPAVLRQMKANMLAANRRIEVRTCHRVLLIDRFAATGATLEQVREMFRRDGIRLVLLADLTP